MNTIYLDHHATTPCDDSVLREMMPYFCEQFGNPSSTQHAPGRAAADAVEQARERTAWIIGAKPCEVIFTSGATESNNLAIRGIISAARKKTAPHIITTSIEHPSVLDTTRALEQHGAVVTRLPVGYGGLVDPDDVVRAITPNTVMVSVMLANNEIGTIQPIIEIAQFCRIHNITMHTDAAQAVGHIPVDVRLLNVDLMSFSAHKMYGPKGAAALYIRSGPPRIRMESPLTGGGQERGIRPGTTAVPLVVGLGAAAVVAAEAMARGEAERVAALRNRLLDALMQIDDVHVNGEMNSRLAHNLNIRIAGIDASELLVLTPRLALSTGSACASTNSKPSHVLRALGLSSEEIRGSLRFGLGRSTNTDTVDTTARLLTTAVMKLRRASTRRASA